MFSKRKYELKKQNDAQYLANLLKRQNKNRFYNQEFSNLHERKKMIKKVMYVLCNGMQYRPSTFFASVSLFDSVISQFSVHKTMLQKVALVCVSLSSKQREQQTDILKLKDLAKLFSLKDAHELKKIENFILKALKFDLSTVTPYDFTSFFLEDPEIFAFLKGQCNSVDKFGYVQLIAKLQLMIIENYEMNKYTPSALAVTVLMLSKEVLGCQVSLPASVKRKLRCEEKNFGPLFGVLRSWMSKESGGFGKRRFKVAEEKCSKSAANVF